MEEKGREAPLTANAEAAATETLGEGSRRRATGTKRKGPSGASSFSSYSTPSKRLAKERNLPSFHSYAHNGPVTRARQSPNKFSATAASPQVLAEQPAASGAADAAGCGENGGSGERMTGEGEELDSMGGPVVDADFDVIRTRESNVHVVPTHAGWFSWERIHHLEEQTMDSFFNGKSEKRTPEIYQKIRNSIMEKFHSDPQTNIESKYLQEVMDFLDHWGLINFHPFPPGASNASVSKMEGSAKTASLSERLYRFEMSYPAPRLAPKKFDPLAPAMPPRLFSESAMVDDLVRPEGPSVEYHCNSCSADCSRKRYHCQKQADFDLCTECYNDGKFGSGMTPADFILMEPAEAPGTGGGSWTDQETLLLLEALELYGENWNEIAEHVATKTKTQCMLHFVQMPIEDPFLVDDANTDENLSRNGNNVPFSKNSSASDAPEKIDTEITESEGRHAASSTSITEEKEDCKTEPAQETSSSSIAVSALRTAFLATGSLVKEGEPLSFADAGNPVMTLAAFLVALVDHDLALSSSRSSLKAITEESPGIQLATRHCFSLENPPKHQKDEQSNGSEGAQMEEAQAPATKVNDEPDNGIEKTDRTASPPDKLPRVSSEECAQDQVANKSTVKDVSVKEATPMKDSHDLSFPVGKSSQTSTGDSHQLCLPIEKTSDNNVNGSNDLNRHGESSLNTTMESRKAQADEVTPSTTDETKTKDFTSPKGSDYSLTDEQMQDAVKDSGKDSDHALNMLPTEEKGHLNGIDSDSALGTKEPAGDDDPKSAVSNGERDSKSHKTEDEASIAKIRRAAVSALSAAAVNAKLLVDQEENQIRHLASLVIEKQLRKLEIKLALFGEIESAISRAREQLDRARQRLLHERAQIIAARLGLPASSSRSIPPSLPPTKPSNLAPQKFPFKRQ
ncbi:unnamed protein product [Spirodela intermedia]|uniref:Uncharacterized protein n=1 Tax=Spirodela intermedia TaxID=51605 RepID=A0A7I8II90_SPIIN|nr:unnamed protein product [Spirodela intermedia]CAA6657585.1 unnamed protein product [Spirodela intermedia]